MDKIHRSILLFVAFSLAIASGFCADLPVLNVDIDFSRTNRAIRPLHGVNKGPLASGGTIDLTEAYRSNQIPFIRLHDCMWPYPDVVDIHSIFRNSSADPENPASYDFALTDEYLSAAHRSGAKFIYRLGESIEHMSTKRFVHPPSDPKKWAQICLGIIRHYNEGWARGFRYGIQYFEIWNEPENRPAMWTGTDEQFLELYRAAAAEIKRVYPSLKVGGPGFGYTGKFEHKTFEPSDFLLKFLRYCRKESVPLDFLSWHCYTADLGDLIERTKAMREVLDREGFEKTENHLTEWNYLPDNSWASFSKSAPARDRRAFYERMSGSEGAAFLVAGLIALQDAPLDVSCIFHGEVGAFGLFNEFGGPTACWEGIRFFSSLAQAQFRKVAVSSGPEQFPIAAVTDSANTFLILVSNCDKTSRAIRIRMQGFGQHSPKTFNIARVPTTVPAETSVNLNDGHISIVLAASALALLEAAPSGKDN